MGRGQPPLLRLAAGVLAVVAPACAFDGSGVAGDVAPDAAPVVVAPDAAPPRIPPGYEPDNGQPAWYRVVDVAVPLALAAADCDDDAAGAHLVVVDDASENASLRRLAGASLAGARVWLGITDAEVEGTWRTVDGLLVDFTDWKDGEPNDFAGAEDCAVMLGDDDPPGQRGRWNDTACVELHPYVCEWRPPGG